MTDMQEHIKANLVAYLLPVVAMAFWGGFLLFMDLRHEKRGAAEIVVTESDLHAVRREKRSLENYQMLAPSEQYNAARAAQIRELTDEEKRLTERLEKLGRSIE